MPITRETATNIADLKRTGFFRIIGNSLLQFEWIDRNRLGDCRLLIVAIHDYSSACRLIQARQLTITLLLEADKSGQSGSWSALSPRPSHVNPRRSHYRATREPRRE